ncbi:MAG: histidinol-phosphatase HisJ family protein [Clostridia bacterium]|nr:histidinol-phosphatase HisJ family protein [Clostridia bacterium]
MKKFKADTHTHTCYSHDAFVSPKDMVETAREMGFDFYGISDHFDYDVDLTKLSETMVARMRAQDPEKYFHNLRHLQEDYAGVVNVLVGVEFAFSELDSVKAEYLAVYEKYQPDFVINSIHCQDGVDYCMRSYPDDKKTTYKEYLRLIRASLDTPYPYDIVGHIGYIMRYVPFENVEISLEEFGEEIDDILTTIIQKGKILEVNTSSKQLETKFLPTESILRRYYELGGRKVSFGSDAHFQSRVGEKWDLVVETLKKIGFQYITVPCKGEHIQVEI